MENTQQPVNINEGLLIKTEINNDEEILANNSRYQAAILPDLD